MAPKRGRTAKKGAVPDGEENQPVKKPKVNPVAEKCQSVTKALTQAQEIPEDTRRMLSNMVHSSLGIAKDQRHPYQTEVIEMLRKALDVVEAGMVKSIEASDTQVKGSGEEKAARSTARTEAQGKVTALSESLSEKKAKIGASAEALKAAEVKLTAAKASQIEGDKAIADATGKKEKLEEALNSIVKPLMEAASESSKKTLATLSKIGATFGFEQAMMNALPGTIKKEASTRTSFDNMVLRQLEAAFVTHIATLDGTLAELKPGKEDREAAVEEAKSTVEAAVSDATTCAAAVKEAKTALQEGEASLATAIAAENAFLPWLKALMDGIDSSKAKLCDFRAGALAAFDHLRERDSCSEETPEPEKTAEKQGELEQTGDALATEAVDAV